MLISEDDYEARQTTRHLFSTPANDQSFLGSIEEWRSGDLAESLELDAEDE